MKTPVARLIRSVMGGGRPSSAVSVVLCTAFFSGCLVGHFRDLESYPKNLGALQEPPLAAEIRTKFEESVAFRKMETATFDNSGIERKVKARLERFVRRALIDSRALQEADRSRFQVTVRLRLIDGGSAADGSRFETFMLLLNLVTLCVFPSQSSVVDSFDIEYSMDGTVLERRTYRYARVQYMSWLAIPFNILITPWTPLLGLNPDGVDPNHALPAMRERIMADARAFRARAAGLERSVDVEPKGPGELPVLP